MSTPAVVDLATNFSVLGSMEPVPYNIGPYAPDFPPTNALGQTWDALSKLEEQIADFDDRLASSLGAALDAPDALASSKLELPRVRDIPNVSTAYSDLNDGLVTVPGAPIQDSVVVRSIVNLYRAGYVMMPGAAARYDRAIERIDSCQIDYWQGRFFPRSKPQFGAARNNLLRILGHTRDDLRYAGEVLVHAALSYELTDEESAERLRQVGQIAPPAGLQPS